MDESLTEYLRNYYKLNQSNLKSGGYFFPSKIGKAYTVSAFYTTFRKCLWKAKISHGGIGNGPWVHDLSYPNLYKIQTFFKYV
jgi:integrase/recombinase XerD